MTDRKFVSSLIILNFVLMVILALPVYDNGMIENIQKSEMISQFDIAAENTTPTMEYYPRKFWGFGISDDFTREKFPVIVVANDIDGIDTVMMHYRYKNESIWNQSELEQVDVNEDVYNGALYFGSNSTISSNQYDSVTIQVFYVANDTLSFTSQSPIMEFTLLSDIMTVDGCPPLYDTPDLWYINGTSDHYVTWQTENGLGTFHDYTFYTLYKGSYLLEKEHWEGELTINVDGLPLGDHLYRLSVALGAWPTYDNVTVHVVEELPTGVNTGSVGPITNTTGLGNLIGIGLIVGVIFIGCIVVILIAKKVISQQS